MTVLLTQGFKQQRCRLFEPVFKPTGIIVAIVGHIEDYMRNNLSVNKSWKNNKETETE